MERYKLSNQEIGINGESKDVLFHREDLGDIPISDIDIGNMRLVNLRLGELIVNPNR
jgi:hypothetical protein